MNIYGTKVVRNSEENRIIVKGLGIGSILGLLIFLIVSLTGPAGTPMGVYFPWFNWLSFLLLVLFIAGMLGVIDSSVFKKLYLLEDLIAPVIIVLILMISAASLVYFNLGGLLNFVIVEITVIFGTYAGLSVVYAVRQKIGR